jgi:hypothetical protein
MSDLNQTKISLKCPACKKSLDPTVQVIYNDRYIRCKCGSELEVGMVEARNLREAVQKQEKAIEDFKIAIERALRTVTVRLNR